METLAFATAGRCPTSRPCKCRRAGGTRAGDHRLGTPRGRPYPSIHSKRHYRRFRPACGHADRRGPCVAPRPVGHPDGGKQPCDGRCLKLVLGRYAPTIAGSIARAHGALACHGSQRWRLDDGQQLPPHVCRLPRSTLGVRALRQRGNPAQALAIEAFAAQNADAVLPIQSVPIQIRDLPTDIYGNRDHATYRDNWKFLDSADDPWGAVHSGSGILINEQLARRAPLAIGDAVEVDGETFVISGIYGDYGNPIGQAIIDEVAFANLFPDVAPTRFGIRIDPANTSDFIENLQAETGIPKANTINQAGIKAFSLGVFDRTFTVTAALNVLTLAVAGFAILMSLLTLTAMRVPQLAPAWAMGLTRRGWAISNSCARSFLRCSRRLLHCPLVLRWHGFCLPL